MQKVLMLFIFGGVLTACSSSPKESNAVLADPAIHMFTDLDGNGINIKDYAGKRVFVNFWATWCKPCVEEMPDLKMLSETLAKEDYVFLFASDESLEKISKFAEKQNLGIKFVHLNKDLQNDLKIQSLPTSFIYDSNGVRKKRITGSMKNWNAPKMVENLLAVE